MQEFTDVTLEDVEDEAVAWFMDPPEKWGIIKDCGLIGKDSRPFPCTAPKNVLYSFDGLTLKGTTKPKISDPKFTLIADVPNYS